MTLNIDTAPAACASPSDASPPSAALPVAGAQTARAVYWQRRNHNAGQSSCDHCKRLASHFRARFGEYEVAAWLCVDCAEMFGLDIYQPAYPVKP